MQSGLKAGYSLLQQSLKRMNADNGYPVITANYPYRTFKQEYIKYFDNAIDCQWVVEQGTTNSALCASGDKVYGDDGSYTQEIQNVYKTFNKASNTISSVRYMTVNSYKKIQCL